MDASKYAHSPTHKAVVTKDHEGLKKILADLPRLSDQAKILSESLSLAEEEKADAISAVIDNRDVPNRDTPLHLAVKLGDDMAAEMLMVAGADWSLQNEQGWSALQEAICKREEKIARIIVKQYQPIAWAKWCRRLPRVVGVMGRMRDFYMEITFQFESSVIPFISKIAPSDTYKIWKRGANLRADMTLAGFDGFRIQRSDQSILFLGDGSEDGTVPSGSLCLVIHKDKEVMNALEGAGAPASDAEVKHEVAAMCRTNIFRPGIDVTQAVLLPQMTWRRQERKETVGSWKAKVYDMHNVVVSLKSRKVPGAMSDDELLSVCNEPETENEGLGDVLTDEERRQLEAALKMDPSDLSNNNCGEIVGHRHSCSMDMSVGKNGETKRKKKGWLDGLTKRDIKHERRDSLCVEDQVSDFIGDLASTSRNNKPGRHSRTFSTVNPGNGNRKKDVNRENEYKKGLRPTLWLSPNFPLQIEELLPLLDILASKVKAIRRLRELLTTKLPMGTFPVKVCCILNIATILVCMF